MIAWIKRHMPKSLFGRALAIIIIPIAIMQIAVAYVFFQAHWQTVTSRLSDAVAADIAVTVELYKQAPSEERAQQLDTMIKEEMRLSIALAAQEPLPTADRRAFFSNLDRTLRSALEGALDDPYWFDTTRYPNHIDIRVDAEGETLRFIAPRERVFASTGFIFLFWLTAATLLLSLVSILFILNQARPIVRLAEAADAFGKGRDIGDFKPGGATEVRQASTAFLDMHDRIQRHIQQRTILLAGVSHDLRTPLTRLKLHFSMADASEENKAAAQDLSDMETMLDGYLDFARGLSGEEIVQVNIAEIVKNIIDKVRAPQPYLKINGQPMANIRAGAVKRALTNLIENAQNYADTVEVTVSDMPDIGDGKKVLIIINDDGPGIAEDERENALKPFVRLDSARNQNVKGVGLGLSVAYDTARAHGGDLTLEKSKMGGLRCEFSLPV